MPGKDVMRSVCLDVLPSGGAEAVSAMLVLHKAHETVRNNVQFSADSCGVFLQLSILCNLCVYMQAMAMLGVSKTS